MKILFCDNSMRGLINFRLPVIKHYLDQGHAVIMIYPKATHEESLENKLPLGVKVIQAPLKPSSMNILADLKFLKFLYSVYKKERPDITCHFTIKPNIYGTFAACMAGVKCKINMVAGLGYVFNRDGIGKAVVRWLYKLGLHRSNMVITLNLSNYNQLLQEGYILPERSIIFECGEGVDLSLFEHTRNEYSTLRFLMVARVLYDKGYSEFVEAGKTIRAKHPEISFELVGPIDTTSPMRVPKEVIDSDVEHGYISYLGVTNDVPSIVGRPGVVVVVSSYHEGMNRAIMEACAMGRPVITSDIPGCKEMVENGVNGYTVPPKDAPALVEAIKRFISLSEEQKVAMGEAGYKLAKQMYDIRFVLDKFDYLLKKLGIL